ncbi:hypothetical protein ERICIV_00946 [Paenibacillus larvae subsp. larvae]|uniref:Uncharacterized protein n=1 Tax=Paenibacillus larvae subsp. larvae TaxID=147375 RepID=A0A2L1TWQ8_9BACL|nr:hypothetical protein [Paenibacillus larvae]AQT85734.1 hypothetical protein B1222_17075 [Paenibacillus larvae subsp. pulvifaciens]AQZ47696.1 hypothetical protein B5S25_15060 [Paenibacillus larvae subsp. pulvifaciens]AVF25131.1 hypothetical protein ERICIII_00926 [Paenibacillus larvae subsp. larvae]AVF29909.1 hypothetical protein ERICIV_00946 [Paenibacillus larvae subsp. larvae]MBH0344485.1 hypothetical protein [Paenibacillus larvae]
MSNEEVIIKSEVKDSTLFLNDGGFSLSEESHWASWTWTMEVLGIDLTKLSTKVYYSSDGYNVIRSNSANNSHYNINPLIIVNDGVSSHWKSGSYAYGSGPFTVYGTATLGFVSASVAIVVQAKPGYVTGWKESI